MDRNDANKKNRWNRLQNAVDGLHITLLVFLALPLIAVIGYELWADWRKTWPVAVEIVAYLGMFVGFLILCGWGILIGAEWMSRLKRNAEFSPSGIFPFAGVAALIGGVCGWFIVGERSIVYHILAAAGGALLGGILAVVKLQQDREAREASDAQASSVDWDDLAQFDSKAQEQYDEPLINSPEEPRTE